MTKTTVIYEGKSLHGSLSKHKFSALIYNRYINFLHNLHKIYEFGHPTLIWGISFRPSVSMWSCQLHLQLNTNHYVYPCQRFSNGNTLEDYNP
jgi:hypothetical protein